MTSGNFSPTLERAIALAFLPPDIEDGADVARRDAGHERARDGGQAAVRQAVTATDGAGAAAGADRTARRTGQLGRAFRLGLDGDRARRARPSGSAPAFWYDAQHRDLGRRGLVLGRRATSSPTGTASSTPLAARASAGTARRPRTRRCTRCTCRSSARRRRARWPSGSGRASRASAPWSLLGLLTRDLAGERAGLIAAALGAVLDRACSPRT